MKRVKSKEMMENIVLIYMILMFSLFLFYFKNYYFDMTPSKYGFYSKVTLVLFLISLIISIVSLFHKGDSLKHRISTWLHSFEKWEILIIVWIISLSITTWICDDSILSLTGKNGRQTGLIFMLMVCGTALLITRHYHLNQSVILVYLCSTSFVFLLGALNFFSIDPFGFFTMLSDYQGGLYLSTIGNINFFSSLICLSLPLSTVLYCYCRQRNSRIIYYICCLLGFTALLIGNSDSGYLGIGSILMLLFFLFFNDHECLKRFLQLCISWIVTGRILGILIIMNPVDARPLITLSSLFCTSSISLIILIVLLLFYLILTKKQIDKQRLYHVRKWFFILFCFVFIFILTVIIFVNVINKEISLGFLSTYLRFDENWGTGRGMIWSHLMEAYAKFPVSQKIFGHGLDTTRLVMINYFPSESLNIYDNAHNELLQYLVTSGIAGLGGYLIICIGLLNKLYKFTKKEPFALAIFSVICCYLIQSIVNINQPITTPLFFMFLGIAGSCIKEFKKEESIQKGL